MSKKKELIKRIKEFNHILTKVVQLRDYIKKYQIIKKEILLIDPSYEFTIIKSIRSQFHINMAMLIIHLYKLCDFKETYSVKKIYNCLFNEYKRQIDFNEDDKKSLNEILNFIHNNDQLIKKISKQRNKFYAHRDLNIDQELVDLTEINWEDLFLLIDNLCEFAKIIKYELINEKFFIKENYSYTKNHIIYYKNSLDINVPETDMPDLSITLDLIIKVLKIKESPYIS